MNPRNAIVCALVAAAGTTASAGVFTWIGSSDGAWDDPANWTGPIGLYPRLTIDSATVTGDFGTAHLNANTALGT
jgi:hypothetical protein